MISGPEGHLALTVPCLVRLSGTVQLHFIPPARPPGPEGQQNAKSLDFRVSRSTVAYSARRL